MFELSMTRMLPYQFKDSFSELLMDVANINYVKYSYEDTLDYCFERSNNIRDLALYDFSQQAKFDADSDKNVFSVIHLNGAHDPNPKLVKKAGITDFCGNFIKVQGIYGFLYITLIGGSAFQDFFRFQDCAAGDICFGAVGYADTACRHDTAC